VQPARALLISLVFMKTIRFLATPVATLLLTLFAAVGSSQPDSQDQAGKIKPCSKCNGTGKIPCPACKNGWAECPGPCLKLSQGVWNHLNIPGQDPGFLWQAFPSDDGKLYIWNQTHVGEVIQTQNGIPVDIGKCPICGGLGRVKCSVCKGTGEVVCNVCKGMKVVLDTESLLNRSTETSPSLFKLKDGRVLTGRKTMVIGTHVTIRTEKGDVEVAQADIVSEEKQASSK
jgi:hypothetical protein